MTRGAVGEQITVEGFQNLRNLRNQLVCLHLTEQCDQNALLAVDAVGVALFVRGKTVDALAYAAVIQESLSVDVLQALFICASLNLERDIHVIFKPAAQIDQIFQRGHRDRIVIVDFDAAEHPFRGVAHLLKSSWIERSVVVVETAAAVQRRVQLIDALDVGNICIGVTRKRNQVCAVLFKIDRKHHHDVRVPFLLSVPRFTLGGIIDADKEDVDDILHHRSVCFFHELHVRIDRGRGRRRVGRLIRHDNRRCIRRGRRFRRLRCDKAEVARFRLRRRRSARAGADFVEVFAGSAVQERGDRRKHQRNNDTEYDDCTRYAGKYHDQFFLIHFNDPFGSYVFMINCTPVFIIFPRKFGFVTNILQIQRIYSIKSVSVRIPTCKNAENRKKSFSFRIDVLYYNRLHMGVNP